MGDSGSNLLAVPGDHGGSNTNVSLSVVKVGLLSELGKSLLATIPLADSKNPLTEEPWEDCFSGKDAVEWISHNCNVTTDSAGLIAQSLMDGKVFFPKHPPEPHFVDGPDSIYSIWDHQLGGKEPAQPSGVLTALTPCYSPSCRSGKCYSPTCARASWRASSFFFLFFFFSFFFIFFHFFKNSLTLTKTPSS